MNGPELSVFVFGIYLVVVVGLGFVFVPNKQLSMFKLPSTNEPWIRVMGFLAGLTGFYYIVAAQNGLTPIFWASVYARFGVLVFLILMVVAKKAKAPVIIFGVVDAAGAVWTLITLM